MVVSCVLALHVLARVLAASSCHARPHTARPPHMSAHVRPTGSGTGAVDFGDGPQPARTPRLGARSGVDGASVRGRAARAEFRRPVASTAGRCRADTGGAGAHGGPVATVGQR